MTCKKVCSSRLSSLEGIGAMRSKPIDTSTTPGVNCQNQLEGITNAIAQTSSIGRVKTDGPFPPKTKKTNDHSSPGTLSKSSPNTPTKGASKKHSTNSPTVEKQKDERSALTKCRRLVLASSPNTELGRRTAVIDPLVHINTLAIMQKMYGYNTNSGQETVTSGSIAASDITTDDHDHPQRTSNQRLDDQSMISDTLMGSAVPSDTRSPPPSVGLDYTPPSVDSGAGNEPVETVLARSTIAKGLAMTTVNPSDPTLAAISEPAATPSSGSPPVQASFPTITGSTPELDESRISLAPEDELNSIRQLLRTPIPVLTNETPAESIKDKCKEFLRLTSGGFSSVISDLSSEARAKSILSEICDDPGIDKAPQLKARCENFLPRLLSGVNTFKRNCDQLQYLTLIVGGCRAVSDIVEKKREKTTELLNTYQAMIDTEALLVSNVAILEAQLAEAKGQVISHRLHMTEVRHTLNIQGDEFSKALKEATAYTFGLDHQNVLRAGFMSEQAALDKDLIAFRASLKKVLTE